MNFAVLDKVLSSDLPTAQRMIMVVLLNHLGDNRDAWPSQDKIAQQVGLSEDKTRPHIKALSESGWIRREKRGHLYHYSIPQPDVSSPSGADMNPTKRSIEPDVLSHQPDVSSPLTLRNVAQTTQETLNEPIIEPPKVGERAEKGGKKTSRHPKPDWRTHNRIHAEEANTVTVPLLAPSNFTIAWQRYQQYRTRRAVDARIASEALSWTVDAAESALRGCERASDSIGWDGVIARIDEAIAGRWQGLNLNNVTNGNGNHRGQPQHQQPMSRAWKVPKP